MEMTKKKLPGDFKKCPGPLHFTLLKQAFSNIRYLYFYTHIFCTPTKINVETIGCGV